MFKAAGFIQEAIEETDLKCSPENIQSILEKKVIIMHYCLKGSLA